MPDETDRVETSDEELFELFTPTGSVELVAIPGNRGHVAIKRLGQYARERYFQESMVYRLDEESVKEETGHADVKLTGAKANMDLLCDCVMKLTGVVIEKATLDGGTTREEIRLPERDEDRRKFLRDIYQGNAARAGLQLTPAFARWLIGQCKRVNMLEDDVRGNARSGADPASSA